MNENFFFHFYLAKISIIFKEGEGGGQDHPRSIR